MNNENWMKQITIKMRVFYFSCIAIMLFGMIMFVTGNVAVNYMGFALDSSERLYVGRNTGIDVYENGTKIKAISPPSSRHYAFTVKDDRIVSAVNNTVYILSLDGEEIESYTDNYEALHDMEKNGKIFILPSGSEYVSKNLFGFYKIMRDDGVCVYSMPLLDYIVNLSFWLAALGLGGFVIYVLIKIGKIPSLLKKCLSL